MNRREYSPKLVLGALLAVSLACLLAGCSEAGFPAVHDMPLPRADTTLTPDQVKQATDDLISERQHLQSIPPVPPPTPEPQKTSLQAPVAPAGTRTAGTDDNGH